jgi:Ca-activated chloride channel family protein
MTCSLTLRTERTLARAHARSRRTLVATVVAPDVPHRAPRPPIDLALVLDRSGSMAGDAKLPLAKEAIRRALLQLDARDRVALVVFDQEVSLLAPLAELSPLHRALMLGALDGVEPRGSTDLGGGWLRGCEQLAAALAAPRAEGALARTTRCIVLTDGQANVGIRDASTFAQHAEALRGRGIVTSAFGVGDDFDELLLRDLARAGGGSFHVIPGADAIAGVLTAELEDALAIVRRDAVLELVADPGVDLQAMGAFPLRRRDGRLFVELGDLAARQELDCAFEATLPRGTVGDDVAVRALLHVAEGRDEALATLRWRLDSHAANDVQPRDAAVDAITARYRLARAREEAARHARAGDRVGAVAAMRDAVHSFAPLASTNEEIASLRDIAESELQEVSAPMSPARLKRMVHDVDKTTRARDEAGRVRRR